MQAHVSSFRFFFFRLGGQDFFSTQPGAGGGGAVEAAEEKTKLFRAHPRPLSKSFLLFLSSTGACAAPVRPSSAGRAAPSARSAACGSRPCSISGCREQLFLRRRRQTARGALEESCKMFFCFFFAEKRKHGCTVCEQQVFVSLLLSLSLLPYCSLFIDACVGQTKKETEKKK